MRIVACTSLIFLAAFFCSGCATIVNGTTQSLAVTSEPSGATLTLDDGTSYTTPANLSLKRNRDYTITVSMDGYETAQMNVDRTVSWWLAGNLIFGGIPGIVIDVISSGMYRFDPETVVVTLRPAGQSERSDPPGLLPAGRLRDIAGLQE